jgi:hypothetical protein
VGFEAAMRALQTIHDAAEGEIMRLSLSERSRSKVDAELERIGIKLAAQLPEKPRYMPGKKVPISGLRGPRNPAARCPS